MEIIIKYDFPCIDADEFDQEEIIDHIKNNFPDSLRIFDKNNEGYWSEEDEPEILISKETTLITTDLQDKGVCNFDTRHVLQFEGLMFLHNANYRKMKYPFMDKNGKKFGKGAILQYTEHAEYLLQTGKMYICWDEEYGCYGYMWEHDMIREIIHPFSDIGELKRDFLDHCEIIGTEEKNPELLKLFKQVEGE